MNYDFDFSVVASQWPAILAGLGMTVAVSAVAIAIGTPLGLGLGLLVQTPLRPARWGVYGLIDSVRSLPPLCAVFLGYYLLPPLVGVPRMSPFLIACVVLAVYLAAFIADIVRGGWRRLPQGAVLAARSTGMSSGQVFWRVQLPLMVRANLPAMVTLWIGTLKHSSLASVIGVYELTHTANTIITNTFRSIETYAVVAAAYLLIVLPFAWFLRRFEEPTAAKAALQ